MRVFMHCAVSALRVNTAYIGGNWHLANAMTSLAFSAVPLFFMMSGYLLFSSSKTSEISYLFKKRIPKLLIPLVAYSALAALHLVRTQGDITFSAFSDMFAMAGSKPLITHFWFMYTLTGMYLISPVLCGGLQNLSSSGKKYLLGLVAIILLMTTLYAILPADEKIYVPYKIPSEMAFFSGHMVSFVLGWLLGQTKRKIPNLLLVVVAILDLLFIIFMTHKVTVENATYTQIYQSQSMGFEILLASCIFLLAKQNLNRPIKFVSRFITPITALSFPIYLLHGVVLAFLNFEMNGTLYPITALGTVKLTLFIVILCYLIIKTVATIKPLCFVFTGMSYKAACNSCNWVFTVRKIKNLFKKTDKQGKIAE
ncbi:MAG: acyltransferase [Ruminococcaceae bacterium]|nr:acyltransferase [Oscillospiraceae bacterium]